MLSSNTMFLIYRIFLDFVFLALVVFFINAFVYAIRRYLLEFWVEKAVKAAEKIITAPKHTKINSQTKKIWVIRFLTDNGFTTGFSANLVDNLIESAVKSLPNK